LTTAFIGDCVKKTKLKDSHRAQMITRRLKKSLKGHIY